MILAGICWMAITPFLVWGSPSGHDFEFHMFSWMDVLSQWKQGIVYPRWAALAHWGYGEARFLFYPPGSWTLGAALGAILPWGMVPGAYCWIVLTAAGMSMYALARQWLRPADALFAAAFYALNPYHLLIVYWRSAYAELLAGALLPLVLLYLVRLKQDGSRPTLCLSLALAGAWLINGPAALMIHYSVAGLAVLFAVREKSARPLIRTTLAVVLGAGLASFYLVPAVYEEGWVNIGQVLSAGVSPQDNFLFMTIADPDHNRFNMLVSVVALAEIAILAFMVWAARRAARDKDAPDKDTPRRDAWMLFSVLGAATAFVMLPASNLLWEHLPKFRYVQLPFRWLLWMNVPLAVLLAAATARPSDDQSSSQRSNDPSGPRPISRPETSRPAFIGWAARALVFVFLLAVLLYAGHRLQPPWWDASRDIAQMSDAVSSGAGYEGTDEYVPVAADPYEIKNNLPRVSDENGAAVTVQMLRWNATEKHFVARSSRAQNLTVRLFNYPAWEVLVNGKRVETLTSDVTGLLTIPVPAGENDVCVHFGSTPDRPVGGIVSLFSIAVLGVGWKITRTFSPKIPRAES